MGRPHEELLEPVACALCGADDCETVYEARYDQEKDFDLVEKFRASGDERTPERPPPTERPQQPSDEHREHQEQELPCSEPHPR